MKINIPKPLREYSIKELNTLISWSDEEIIEWTQFQEQVMAELERRGKLKK